MCSTQLSARLVWIERLSRSVNIFGISFVCYWPSVCPVRSISLIWFIHDLCLCYAVVGVKRYVWWKIYNPVFQWQFHFYTLAEKHNSFQQETWVNIKMCSIKIMTAFLVWLKEPHNFVATHLLNLEKPNNVSQFAVFLKKEKRCEIVYSARLQIYTLFLISIVYYTCWGRHTLSSDTSYLISFKSLLW